MRLRESRDCHAPQSDRRPGLIRCSQTDRGLNRERNQHGVVADHPHPATDRNRRRGSRGGGDGQRRLCRSAERRSSASRHGGAGAAFRRRHGPSRYSNAVSNSIRQPDLHAHSGSYADAGSVLPQPDTCGYPHQHAHVYAARNTAHPGRYAHGDAAHRVDADTSTRLFR